MTTPPATSTPPAKDAPASTEAPPARSIPEVALAATRHRLFYPAAILSW